MVHAGLALLRPVKPSRQLRRPQRHSKYSFTTTGHIHYQILRIYTWRIADIRHLVLPIHLAAAPPRSTYPHGGSLPQRHLVFHFPQVPYSSGTPTYAVHLRVLPPPHLRRTGALRFPSTFFILQPLPLLEVQQRPTHPYNFNKLPGPQTA